MPVPDPLETVALYSTHELINSVRGLLQTHITFTAHPAIDPTKPLLFCANHFTRMETFILPSVLHANLGIKVYSLADAGLFQTKLSNYLKTLGTIATDDLNRNETIESSLAAGTRNWIIYPEGRMVKNKKTKYEAGDFYLCDVDHWHKIHTGAAVMALESELDRSARMKAHLPDTALDAIQIIPVTLSYTPLRPGKNLFTDMAASIVTDVQERTLEELEIEGNLLTGGTIDIYCDAPIDVAQFIHQARTSCGIPDDAPQAHQAIVECARHTLTNYLMDKIYKNIQLNFDHFFALALRYASPSGLRLETFKSILFLSVQRVKNLRQFRIHKNLGRELFRLLIDEPHALFDDALALAVDQGIVTRIDADHIQVHAELLEREHTFHTVRLENTFKVLLNEIAILPVVAQSVKALTEIPHRERAVEIMGVLYTLDLKRFDRDYQRFYSLMLSKPKEVGTPQLMFNPDFKRGMVISHGYKAAPKEMELLARHIHAQGINVYTTRMQGHGTAPEDLKHSTFHGWLEGFNRGFAALRGVSETFYLCGFSAGGLLALSAAASKQHPVDGLICINSAIAIDDLRFNFLMPALDTVTHLLSVIDSDIEYLHDTPENPHINYDTHPVSAVRELKNLIEYTKPLLPRITVPMLIIQGTHDPVVAPNGAQFIYDTVASTNKTLVMIEADEHVIVTSDRKEEVFNAVDRFLGALPL